jgi:hypothetical protein
MPMLLPSIFFTPFDIFRLFLMLIIYADFAAADAYAIR